MVDAKGGRVEGRGSGSMLLLVNSRNTIVAWVNMQWAR